MFITFTFEEFLEMVTKYNNDLWPMHLFVYALAGIAIFLAVKKTSFSSRIISGILAFFWLWIGIVFNLMYFSKIFPMANIFTILFIIQGIIFVVTGVFKQSLSFSIKTDIYGVLGGIFILYAMVAYPLIEYLLGRGYPQILPFGLISCPTTIFTLGMLLCCDRRLPKYVLIIPFLYSLSGIIPISLGIVEDIGLVISGLCATFLILYRDRMKVRE